jgi:hypothetical protein
METINKREAWNKGKLVGQKPPLKPKDIWAMRIHLQNAQAVRDLAMFNLAIDSRLRGCDLVSLRVRDVAHGNRPADDANSSAARCLGTRAPPESVDQLVRAGIDNQIIDRRNGY